MTTSKQRQSWIKLEQGMLMGLFACAILLASPFILLIALYGWLKVKFFHHKPEI